MAIQENGSGKFLTDSGASFMNPNTGREGMPFLSPELVQKPPKLKILLNGQGEGAAMLMDKAIADGHEIVGVVATIKGLKEGNPDPLRAKAMEAGIPIVNLGDINNKKPDDERFIAAKEKMKGWDADLGVGFYLQAIMDTETINIPKYGTMNTHYSRLPDNRGRDAMNRSVMNGEDIGISTFMMNEIVDGGDIVDQATFPNPGDKSQGALYYQHVEDFVDFVSCSINKMAVGIDEHRKNGAPLPVSPQDHAKATEYPPLTTAELFIDFTKINAITARNYMNAGGPGATAIIEGDVYKVAKPDIKQGPPLQPGRVVELTPDSATVEALQGIVTIGRRSKTS